MAEEETLKLPECLSYEFFERNRYKISEVAPYEGICNNGFIKVYTQQGRAYWHAQNEAGHITPDWKFHVSVHHDDLKNAWNLVLAIFLQMRCRSGLKTVYLPEANPQKGRQITIYILKYAQEYKKSSFANDYQLGVALEHSNQFWSEMVSQIEYVLDSYEIRDNGLTEGDLAIGRYVSLRNEAFVRHGNSKQAIYPPDCRGWNPLEQQLPIDVNKLIKSIARDIFAREGTNLPIWIAMGSVAIAALIAWKWGIKRIT